MIPDIKCMEEICFNDECLNPRSVCNCICMCVCTYVYITLVVQSHILRLFLGTINFKVQSARNQGQAHFEWPLVCED
jgi:hypothetical protein